MREFDALPKELRAWVARAKLPWRARSVRTTYELALARTGSERQALAELERVQARLVAKDAGRIWGADHPAADG